MNNAKAPWRTTIALLPEPRSASRARKLIRNAPLPLATAETAELLISELATNAILYAKGEFVVRIEISRNLYVEVANHSPLVPLPLSPQGNASQGRGLQIVDALASSWGVEPTSRGKVLWFSLDLPEVQVQAS